jgi:hypothetical protein
MSRSGAAATAIAAPEGHPPTDAPGGAHEVGQTAARTGPPLTGRCGRCDHPLTGDEVSDDFCSEVCQVLWGLYRVDVAAAHEPTPAGHRLGIHREEVQIWALPKVSASPRVCTG